MPRKAMFPDVCARCPHPINKGDEVVPSNGHFIHAQCASGQDESESIPAPAKKRAAKKSDAKPWKSGHCNDGNPTDSHKRCERNPRKDGVPCTCFCHMAPDAPHAPTNEKSSEASGDPVDLRATTAHEGGLVDGGGTAAVDQVLAEAGTPGRGVTIEGLSNDEYHAKTEWFSSTMLKAALPEDYKPADSQAALDFGTLFHTAVLEPDLLDQFVALDAAKVGVKADGTQASNPTSTKAWKDAVAEVAASGKTVVSQADLDKVQFMRDAVAAHPVASQLLFSEDGRSEVSAFATDEDGIRHKARFDRLIPGAGIDLKSTSSKPGEDSLARTVVDFGYDLSAYHYSTVAKLLGLDVQAFAFVFCSKEVDPRTGLHLVTVAELDAEFLNRGRLLRDLAIERLTDPTVPAYQGATGFLTISAPPWALRKVS